MDKRHRKPKARRDGDRSTARAAPGTVDGGAAVIVGVHPVRERLANADGIRELLILEASASGSRHDDITARAAAGRVAVRRVDGPTLDQLAGGAVHQGIALLVEPRAPWDQHQLLSAVEAELAQGHAPLLLALDGVTDPHNLGAAMRSAAAVGALAVIVPQDRAVGLTPIVRKAAAGAAERLPLAIVTNLSRCLRDLQQLGVWVVGLAGDEGSDSLWALDLKHACTIVAGAEGQGLRRLTRETCDHLARIPMVAGTESLNVSVASAVALYECLRQRTS